MRQAQGQGVDATSCKEINREQQILGTNKSFSFIHNLFFRTYSQGPAIVVSCIFGVMTFINCAGS